MGERTGCGLVTHVVQEICGWTDEGDAFALAGAGEGGVFGEETIARVDHSHALGLREFYDPFVVEIGTDWAFRGIELVCFVRFETVDGKTVFLCENRNGA